MISLNSNQTIQVEKVCELEINHFLIPHCLMITLRKEGNKEFSILCNHKFHLHMQHFGAQVNMVHGVLEIKWRITSEILRKLANKHEDGLNCDSRSAPQMYQRVFLL